jgi:hypothetical protein
MFLLGKFAFPSDLLGIMPVGEVAVVAKDESAGRAFDVAVGCALAFPAESRPIAATGTAFLVVHENAVELRDRLMK